MSEFEHREVTNSTPIAVDTDGNAFTEYTREKESIIRSERLDAQHPLVKVDLETILVQDGGCGVSIVIQDFGLPPRTININGDFNKMSDISRMSRDDEHYTAAPKKLTMKVVSPEQTRTYSFDDRLLPVDDETVVLERGRAMLFAHDGLPSDERTGYIDGGIWELIALLPRGYYGPKDFSDAETTYLRGWTPLIGLSYEEGTLSLYSLDDVHAEVQYQQVRSLADETYEVVGDVVDEIDVEQLLTGLMTGSDEAKNIFKVLMEQRRETLATVDTLQVELQKFQQGTDSLETVLAGVKRKLHEARIEAFRLDGEVTRLRKQADATDQSSRETESEYIRNIFGGAKASEKDPQGHCSALGIDPTFLFALNPEAASRVIKGIHRGLAMQFHSDRQNESDDEAMKNINVAVDLVLNRLRDGYWGRR